MGDSAVCATSTHIRDRAAALFARQGYSGTSIQEIADAAGVSKANVFHHFHNKRDLYRAVVHAAQFTFESELRALPAAGPPGERVTAIAGAHLEYLLRRSDVVRLVIRELLDPTAELDENAVAETLNENFKRLAGALSDQGLGVAPGRPAAEGALLIVAANLLYFLLGTGVGKLDGLEDMDRTGFAQWVSRTALSGVVSEVSRT